MKKISQVITTLIVLCISIPAFALDAPVLTLTTAGLDVTASWSSVSVASSYTLYYAPSPYTGPDSIKNISMGANRSFTAKLWSGASFYVAVTAYHEYSGESGYSNIELFTIPFSNATYSVSGNISYDGLYSGSNTTIYIRGYSSNTKATGNPEYVTSVSEQGEYNLDLGDYQGDLYLSAFMDVDNSGSDSGPSATGILTDGVYADPIGCYGEYTFEDSGPVKITVEGLETGIDFELADSGVIQVSFSDTGHATVGVISTGNISDEFLHHMHVEVKDTSEIFYLPVPAKSNWYFKVKFDDNPKAQLYDYPVDISENSIIDVRF